MGAQPAVCSTSTQQAKDELKPIPMDIADHNAVLADRISPWSKKLPDQDRRPPESSRHGLSLDCCANAVLADNMEQLFGQPRAPQDEVQSVDEEDCERLVGGDGSELEALGGLSSMRHRQQEAEQQKEHSVPF
mmetsp:Transcript_24005/g.50970  ORF Transcript_24005/g.50970 Transcript_24005/m.50970 type:complete len:133 (+) Transcript_24005:74-472(+)